MHRPTTALLAAIAALAFACAPAGAASITNGSFTDGLSGWGVWNAPSGGPVGPDNENPLPPGVSGTWLPYDSAMLPVSNHEHIAPPDGAAAVMDQDEPASSVLWQDVTLESGSRHTLTFQYWYANEWGSMEPGPTALEGPEPEPSPWLIPEPLSFLLDGPKQFIRVDVVKASAAPESTEPSDILKTILMPVGADAREVNWTSASVDLSEFAGQSVKLRFIDTGNMMYLHFGVDQVAISSEPVAPPVTDPGAPIIKVLQTTPDSYDADGKLGVKVDYSLNRAATVTVRTLQAREGVKKGDECVRPKPHRKVKKSKQCTRWILLEGLQTFEAAAGSNSFAFNGKPDGKALRPGKYRLLFSAYVMGYGENPSQATASFTIR